MKQTQGPCWTDWLFVLPQYVLPHHLISRLILRATRIKVRWFKNMLIRWAIKKFRVNMSEAKDQNIDHFANFNEFFTRELAANARPQAQDPRQVLCPVDGRISQMGYIEGDTIFQAKGYHYDITSLLGGDAVMAEKFRGGAFATLYLSPRDYHRYHMPWSGRLTDMIYVPGRLFSVNPTTVRRVRNVFARNERVVALFETSIGPMAMIPVGALNVACIETVWHGVVTPPHRQPVGRWHYNRADDMIQLNKGDEMGRFNMGSTVILLFAANAIRWDAKLQAGDAIVVGQAIAVTQ